MSEHNVYYARKPDPERGYTPKRLPWPEDLDESEHRGCRIDASLGEGFGVDVRLRREDLTVDPVELTVYLVDAEHEVLADARIGLSMTEDQPEMSLRVFADRRLVSLHEDWQVLCEQVQPIYLRWCLEVIGTGGRILGRVALDDRFVAD
jgi:hypothetical protein